jgi:hypothetical protein
LAPPSLDRCRTRRVAPAAFTTASTTSNSSKPMTFENHRSNRYWLPRLLFANRSMIRENRPRASASPASGPRSPATWSSARSTVNVVGGASDGFVLGS